MGLISTGFTLVIFEDDDNEFGVKIGTPDALDGAWQFTVKCEILEITYQATA